MAQQFHFFAAVFFAGFILVDRFVLRRVYDKYVLKPLYDTAVIPLAISAAALIISGIFMWQNNAIYITKSALGIATITLFFACAVIQEKLSKPLRFLYRLITTLLLITTLIIGRFLAS